MIVKAFKNKKVEIILFAQLKDILSDRVCLEIDQNPTAGELLKVLAKHNPTAKSLLKQSRVADEERILPDETPIKDNSICYVLPPTSER